MNTQLSPRSNMTINGSPRFNPRKIKQHPFRVLGVVLLLGFAAYLAYATIYAATYECQTEMNGEMEQCHKYQIEPTFQDLGVVSSSACPNNPPSNCP